MSAAPEKRVSNSLHFDPVQPALARQFDLLLGAPGAMARLRKLIHTLAVQGKLVPQDFRDEPAWALLKRIRAEKEQLVARGEAKKSKPWQEVTDDEKAFRLPPGWDWVRLGDVQLFTNGYAFKSDQFSREGVGVVRIGNVQRGEITESGMVYLPNSLAEGIDAQFFIEPGDLVITMTGDVKLAFNRSSSRYLLNQRVGKIRPLLVSPDFLVICLNLVADKTIANASGSVIPNVSTGEINATPIALPPLGEQARIVARADELMRLCDALEDKGRLEAEQHARLLGTLLGALTGSSTPEELSANWQRVADHFDMLIDRPESVDVLEQIVLQLAVRGLLVRQDSSEEPAAILIERIGDEKNRLVTNGKARKDKPLPPVTEDACPCALPEDWKWVRLGSVVSISTGKLDANAANTGGRFPFFTCSSTPLSIDSYSFDCSAVLLAGNGDFNLKMYSGKFDAYQRTYVIEPCLIELKFLYYSLKQGIERISSSQRGTAVPYLRLGDITESMFALPPLAEQSRIVERIETLLQICAALRLRLTASQITQSHLADTLVGEVA